MTGFQVPKCADCGHARSDHKSAGTHWPHPSSYGVCLRHGCDCTEFIPLDPSSRKEPSHVQVQDDGDRDHPVRSAVAACVRRGVTAAVVLDLDPGRVSPGLPVSDSGVHMTNTGGRIGTTPEPGIPLWLIGAAWFVFMVALSIAIVVSAFSGGGCP